MADHSIDTGKERKLLNEEIEDAYLDCARSDTFLRTHFQTGNGIIWHLFEQYYSHVSYLYNLTSDLPQMVSSEQVKKEMFDWLNLPPTRNNNRKELEERCKDGMKIFKNYRSELGKNGVITLPS
jgi:hypothetical protein